MKTLLANTRNHTLLNHSRVVSDVAVYLGNHLGLSDDLLESIRLGGLLHDIGKSCIQFQSYLTGTSTLDFNVSTVSLHHEISWAILKSHGFKDSYALNSIYWHHAKPLDSKYNYRKTVDEILDNISDSDIELVRSFCSELGVELSDDYSDGDVNIPTLYRNGRDRSINAKLLTVRGCVIAADRYVSSLDSLNGDYLNDDRLHNYLGDVGILDYTVPINYDIDRFNIQLDCVSSAIEYKTSQVNAPAGFGKTLQGVLYSLKRGKRVFWVVPRNVIAESLYPNILRELSALGVSKSVELFLGGERTLCTDSSVGECLSDIVITNIDNLVNPMVSNLVADRLYLSLSSDVIFDEFHEFVSDSPMFAAFIHLMRARHCICSSSHTLLLSATPMNIHTLWDMPELETKVFPSKGTHYPAAHDGLYNINLVAGDTIPNPVLGGVSITNSIRNAQHIKRDGNADILVHSSYTDAHRKILMDHLLMEFGKGGSGISSGIKVVSSPVLQAALDISFTSLNESVLSAEATLQRIGRTNRWGEQSEIPLVNIWVSPDSNKAEMGAIRTMFNVHLKTLWVTHLQSNIDDSNISLNDLYDIYSSFYSKYGRDVKEWLNECLKRGTDVLVDYGPVKLPDLPKNKKDVSGKSLRTPTGSYYYIVKDNNGDWLPVGSEFSFSFNELRDSVNESNRTMNDWKHVLKSVVTSGYTGFAYRYENIRKGRTKKMATLSFDGIKVWSKDRNTPYPRNDKVYHCNGMGNSIDDIGLGLINS